MMSELKPCPFCGEESGLVFAEVLPTMWGVNGR